MQIASSRRKKIKKSAYDKHVADCGEEERCKEDGVKQPMKDVCRVVCYKQKHFKHIEDSSDLNRVCVMTSHLSDVIFSSKYLYNVIYLLYLDTSEPDMNREHYTVTCTLAKPSILLIVFYGVLLSAVGVLYDVIIFINNTLSRKSDIKFINSLTSSKSRFMTS